MAGKAPEVLREIAQMYTENISGKGVGPNSVGWRDEQTQALRFEKLACVIDASDEPVTYNDFGCGYAAMFLFLRDRAGAPLGRYYGYDISAEMLAAARQLVSDERLTLMNADHLTEEADYSFVSGTFNVRFGASNDEWRGYIERVLHDMASHSRRGFAFNLLTSYVDWKEPHLFYGDPAYFFDFCVRTFSRRVALLHDYPLYEWTITVRL